DLERVSVSSHGGKVDAFQYLAAEGFEPARQVANADTEDQPGVRRTAPADEAPMPRPVLRASTGDVARPEDHVSVIQRCHQSWNVNGIVRQIAVHLHDDVGTLTQHVTEPGKVRGPETRAIGTVQHVDPGMLVSKLGGERAGAVG